MMNLFFYSLFALLVLCAFMVIIAQHPVFSLLFLVGCFILSAFILFLLECEFLALLFIVVYVGAIAILFLFAVMMLESKFTNLSKNAFRYIPISFFFALIFLYPFLTEIFSAFDQNPFSKTFYINVYQNWYDLIDSVTDIEVYGQVLYSYFVLQFLIAGLILLMVLIGVVYLTNNFNSLGILEQSDFKQLSRSTLFF